MQREARGGDVVCERTNAAVEPDVDVEFVEEVLMRTLATVTDQDLQVTTHSEQMIDNSEIEVEWPGKSRSTSVTIPRQQIIEAVRETFLNDEADGYLDLHLRLNAFQRILITVFPHLSLFCFWPWNKDTSHTRLHETHEEEDRVQLNTLGHSPEPEISKQVRFTDQEDFNGPNNESGHQSPLRYDPHQIRETV